MGLAQRRGVNRHASLATSSGLGAGVALRHRRASGISLGPQAATISPSRVPRQGIEPLLPKQRAESSNLFSRSIPIFNQYQSPSSRLLRAQPGSDAARRPTIDHESYAAAI